MICKRSIRNKPELNLNSSPNTKGTNMKSWQCIVCGFIYDEAKGLPEDGIAPGTAWADVPDNWECPDCGVSKSDFEMVQI
jgi:rubredoxin